MTTDKLIDRICLNAFILTCSLCGFASPLLLPLLFDDQSQGMIALALGWFLAKCYWHPYRLLGWVPVVAILLLFAAVWLALAGEGSPTACIVFNFGVGSTIGTTRRSPVGHMASYNKIFEAVCEDIQRYAFGLGSFLAFAALAASILYYVESKMVFRAAVIGMALVYFLFVWLTLFRPFFELLIEPPLWFSYRIRGAGPGLVGFPTRGPCLVVANHACWLDPIFLAKLLPRPLTPMMTGRFYDLPVMSFLMRRFGIIRVREVAVRREAPPEIGEAVAALDRGECVVVFPEGYLRRTEDRYLRRFGQGVWQILKARPDTPVYACWIEGGWGSYTSYFQGPPTKNKKPDFRRPIHVAVSEAVIVEPAVLETHLATRIYFMNRVIEARRHLGLPDLPRYEVPGHEEGQALE